MLHDPQIPSVIALRLDITSRLDSRSELSFVERARFRLRLNTTVDDLDRGKANVTETHHALERLLAELADAERPHGLCIDESADPTADRSLVTSS